MFTQAIVRSPAASAAKGQTSVDLGIPDIELLMEQHQRYVDTLKSIGLNIIQLDALEEYPDAYFVEDVAIVVPEIAVITRPGAESRRNETQYITDSIAKLRNTENILEPGTLDGGDVLIFNKHCIVGLSERTNREGATQLVHILERFDYHCDIVTAPEALHFKSSVNYCDDSTLLVTESCQHLECIARYEKLVVPAGQEYSANVVSINGNVLVSEDFPETRQLLNDNGFKTIAMPTSEIAKMDGGLTCLSLRFT